MISDKITRSRHLEFSFFSMPHRETGRCHDDSLEHGLGLMHKLLRTDTGKGSKALLSLSIYIAIKVQLTDLSNEDRKKFATLFRSIAYKVENEDFPDVKLWRSFWGRKRIPRGCDADNNV
jgi:hypothetical protein